MNLYIDFYERRSDVIERRLIPVNWRDIAARFGHPYSATDSPVNYSQKRHDHPDDKARDEFLRFFVKDHPVDDQGRISL